MKTYSINKIESNSPQDTMRIELFLSDYCNYKCWYCSEESNGKTVRWPDLDTLLPNFLHLLDYYKLQGKRKFIIHIGGGEPSMWPNVVDFVKAIKEHSHCIVTLTTNGSRTLRWWHDNVKHFDHIGLSVHHESADADHLSQVGDIIYKNKVSMWATVLMDPAYWNKCIDIISTLKNSRYKWSITADQIHHPTINYSEDQLKYLQKRQQRENSILYEFFVCRLKRPHYPNPTIYFDNKSKTVPNHWLLLNGFNNFKGWECNLGVDTLFIDKRGQLKGTCGNKLYNEVFYYNIYDTDFINAFKPAIRPVICEMTRCVCQPEVNCTKSLH